MSVSDRRFRDDQHLANNPLEVAITERDRRVLDMVQDAIHYKQARLAYQPVVRATESRSVGFFEGLIRILDSTGRVIPANEFMPTIENTELGREIDVIALELGCQALSQMPDLRLSINMSARSIGYGPWTKLLEHQLSRDDTIGPRLILEITESSAMLVPEIVTDFMDRLQSCGICFALDDFGAGYTALRYFKDFLFDILKIDGQFIQGISRNPDNRVLTSAMIQIANQFDMLCVAEMVECAEDARLLQELGIDCMQGYYFGAPKLKPEWSASSTAAHRKTA